MLLEERPLSTSYPHNFGVTCRDREMDVIVCGYDAGAMGSASLAAIKRSYLGIMPVGLNVHAKG